MSEINEFIDLLEEKKSKITVNLERPFYVQPEDRISYRAHRILIILGNLNTKNGLSKEVVACVDFLLRNPVYQRSFILQYFDGQKNILEKLKSHRLTSDVVDTDRNIVQYKSVPWDLRFNDMFLYLLVRDWVSFIGSKANLRAILTEKGNEYFQRVTEIFPQELNFLDLFGSRVTEEKAIRIITEVIPNTYWNQQ